MPTLSTDFLHVYVYMVCMHVCIYMCMYMCGGAAYARVWKPKLSTRSLPQSLSTVHGDGSLVEPLQLNRELPDTGWSSQTPRSGGGLSSPFKY